MCFRKAKMASVSSRRALKMAKASSRRASKRKLASSVGNPPSQFSKVTLLSPSLLLLEIPADTNTSFPVWEAVRSQQVDIAWTFDPYSIVCHLTPKQKYASTSGHSVSTVAALPPINPQSQPAIQVVTQQHATGVLLTFTPNSLPGQPQTVPPNPTTSLFISMPFNVTQPQLAQLPSTPTNQTPTKLPVASKMPAPSPFHTKSSSNIKICDNFLLGICYEEERCKMHHTPYPFHWQLWCTNTHQWVNISRRSQVLLERLYCDENLETVCIKDG